MLMKGFALLGLGIVLLASCIAQSDSVIRPSPIPPAIRVVPIRTPEARTNLDVRLPQGWTAEQRGEFCIPIPPNLHLVTEVLQGRSRAYDLPLLEHVSLSIPYTLANDHIGGNISFTTIPFPGDLADWIEHERNRQATGSPLDEQSIYSLMIAERPAVYYERRSTKAEETGFYAIDITDLGVEKDRIFIVNGKADSQMFHRIVDLLRRELFYPRCRGI